MTTAFKKLEVKKYPIAAATSKGEAGYWKKFNFPVIVKEYSAINHVNFCSSSPGDFLVTCSSKLHIFSTTTNQVKRTITRFKDSAFGARFRRDGKLIIAGFENGAVKVFDVSSRTILREFKQHSKATHVAGFVPSSTQVYSASDDCTVRCADIPTQKELSCLQGHNDYIRSGDSCLLNSNILITGSYDHTVKLWDLRSQECTLTADHGNPVESVLLYPNCGLCISAGGNNIKVWDILSGGKLLTSFSNHQKTITTMCFDGSYTRLLSGSIDRHVKVYDTTDYSVVANLDYPSAITSIGLSESGSHLVVGMADGLISIKEKMKKKVEDKVALKREEPVRGSYRYFVRGQSDKPQEGDVVVEKEKHKKMSETDTLLRRFEYRTALDSVLRCRKIAPPRVISLIVELARRDGLKFALSSRDAAGIIPILNFIVRNICNPRYSNILTDVANLLLDIYTPVIGENEETDKLLKRLKGKLSQELLYHKQAFEVLGTIDALTSASTIHSTNDDMMT